MKDANWSVYGSALATTMGVAFVVCAIFDAVFPPFGLLRWLAPASPWPITGSVMALVVGWALFVVAGFVLGATYGIAWWFWGRRLI